MSETTISGCAARILVVDDTSANLQLLTNLLTEQDYTVHPASDGELALEFVRTTLPDLVLLDIRMPGMDGYEVCRRLKADERTRAVPVMFISILEDEHDKVRGFREGAVDYINKPFQREEVLARIRTHLHREMAERMRTEKRLAVMAYALDRVHEAAYLIDEHARFLYVNEEARRRLGYSREELLRLRVADVDPDWPVENWTDHWRDLAAHGTLTFEGRHRTRDGCIFPVEIKANYFEYDGQGLNLALVRDISERKRMEADLENERLRLKTLIQTIPDPVWLKDPHGVFLACNASFALLYDTTESALIGTTDYEHLEPEQAAFFQRMDREAIEAGRTRTNEEWVTFAGDGHRELWETRKTPLFDEAGEVVGVLGIARDITERKRMEEQLRRSEQQFRTLAENAPDVIVRYDRECRCLYVNPAFEHETEIPVREALHIVPSADRWRISIPLEEYLARLGQVMATGVPAEIALEWPRLDTGRVTSHAFHVVAERNPEGEIVGCLAIGHNITALKEAELRLAKLAETSPGVMFNFLLSPDGSMHMPYASPRIEELNGLRSEERMADMSEAFARVHPDDLPRVLVSIPESARTLSSWHAEFRIMHPAKGEIWVEGRAAPERQPDGGTLWHGFFHDITERKRVEESLRVKREQLAAMTVELSLTEERERRRIAAELHDHIGQTLLLGRIKFGTVAEVFEAANDKDTYEEIRSLLDRTIRDVRSLTQQLHPPLLASVGLEAALEWLARRMAADYALQVAFLDDHAAKPLTEELAAVVYQSARELLINVAKHAGAGEAQLTIGREAELCVLTVRDQGVGFTCIPDLCTTMAPDCSFGLFNIRQRIKLLGGEVVIESAPRQGTCATIRVPLAIG